MIRYGVQALTKPTKVSGAIQKKEQAPTNGDLWLYSGRQEDALEMANTDKRLVFEFVDKSLRAMAEERARQCRFYQFSCKRKARDIGIDQE